MEKLYAACAHLPPNFRYIRSLLEEGNYSPEVLAEVMLKHVDKNCWFEVGDFLYANGRYPEKHEVHGAYIYELTELMLEFGFDPSISIDHDSFANALDLVDYGYVAADTMRLLLEHGADPNMRFDSESVFEVADTAVILDVTYGFVGEVTDENSYLYDWRIYDVKFHFWLVLMGYGARLRDGSLSVKMMDGYSIDIFRQHEKFDYRIEYLSKTLGDWKMYIFNRKTKEVVATFR